MKKAGLWKRNNDG